MSIQRNPSPAARKRRAAARRNQEQAWRAKNGPVISGCIPAPATPFADPRDMTPTRHHDPQPAAEAYSPTRAAILAGLPVLLASDPAADETVAEAVASMKLNQIAALFTEPMTGGEFRRRVTSIIRPETPVAPPMRRPDPGAALERARTRFAAWMEANPRDFDDSDPPWEEDGQTSNSG